MKAIVSLSGGMDSATLLGELHHSSGMEVALAVGFQYGSKHNTHELIAARDVAAVYQVPFKIIDVTAIFGNIKSNLLAGGGDLPKGHYEAESMRQTVVPGRNSIFIAVLTGIAESLGAKGVYVGVHAGDHYIYPDCRPNFINAMNYAMELASDHKVVVKAPFLYLNKEQILKRGLEFPTPVPYHLTRTCYSSWETACGVCGSCQERLSAFLANGIEDPIAYSSNRKLFPK